MGLIEALSENWTEIAAAIGVLLATIVAVWRSTRKKGPPPGTPLLLVLALPVLTGCGLFSSGSAAQYVPLVTSALDAFIAEAAKHGADVEELPVSCEHEWHPPPKQGEPGKLLMLCETEIR